MKMLRTKKVLALITAAVLATLLISGCKASNSNVLRVGVDDSYPPMEYKDADGKTTIGFDVDVAQELAKRLGKTKVEFVSNDWTGIFAALETDKFDVIISSVSINEERLNEHSLTNPYIGNKLVIVTNKDNTSIKAPEDLKEKKVGVQAGTTSEDFCSDLIANGNMAQANLNTYPLVTQPFLDLDAGRIEAIVVDVVVAKYYISNNKDKYALSWESPDAEPMAFCFKKKDTELRDKANGILAEMQNDGTMKRISEKWFGEDVTTNLK